MENSQKNFNGPLLLMIVAALIVGGGVYIYESKKTEAPVVINTETQQANQVHPTNTQTSPVTSSQTMSLLIVQTNGGRCQYGVCSSQITIKKNGTFTTESGNGETKSGNLDVTAVNNLQTLIENSNYSTLRSTPFTGTCPTAYDGSEFTYKFQTSHGEEIIASCKTKIDLSSPLFKEIQDILNAIYSR